ncbi:hypothetical protein [Haloarchaeobius amylolyticus]|uniref:hypothetical protein n=1 Tax=Haloarchaeobius amylolyticus TaxID=1198296 RepID=UPI00226E778C|nr:hypothetical protein [Haloarchaeobius amylolyticus]
MDRRTLVEGLGCVFCGLTAGCLTADDSGSTAEIALLELENHRRDESQEFSVEIAADEVVFERSPRLGPAGSGTAAVAYENPVEPGTYTVNVAAAGRSVTAETSDLRTAEHSCLRLQCYLGETTLHLEHGTYERCDRPRTENTVRYQESR